MLKAAPGLMAEGVRMLWTLRRAGVPVLWSTSLRGLTGSGRVEAAVLPDRTIPVDVVALNAGFQPEVGPRAGVGRAASVRGQRPRSSGDGDRRGRPHLAWARCSRSAMARRWAARGWRPRVDAWPVWRRPATWVTRRRRMRGHGFRYGGRWRFRTHCGERFRCHPSIPASIADATIVCRCEEVTAGALRTELAAGLRSLAALKKATRAGMGRCQGRFCAATVARLCPGAARAGRVRRTARAGAAGAGGAADARGPGIPGAAAGGPDAGSSC